ncbi:mycofactocin-coupled SDR family oxidoreductase [Saccharopolyspora elongata]|uniref:SDR family oxidoreductase n=1 Tax=Saccharopolyspora elongata TaxID=2530387 RepID=A0A4R4Y4S2_9PSEU|nr:mycofactocin-coupled SDR family oxidoreductase [Saccharopolyspora elongata]TDD39176.1 SDR family oxidoreductase [Saccharopolyspora elongata]
MTGRPTAVVTGAARGIGAAVVRRLSDDGWNVFAVDLCEDDPAVPYPLGTADQLRSLESGTVTAVLGDVREQGVLDAAVEQALHRHGRLDAAVGAAAVVLGGQPLWETTDQQWNALFATDVVGLLNLARAAVPAMLGAPEPRRGRFVALASAAAHTGLWRLGAYCAAKHAVLGLVRGLAADLQGTGIGAVAVSPGSTRTDMLRATAALYGLSNMDDLARHQLVNRLLEPEEVAAAVAWACSPEASAINGTVLHADGGFMG